MTNRQATKLLPGARIRRKDMPDDTEIFVVERVEGTAHRSKGILIIHAGGHTFEPWEIARADPMQGWPAKSQGRS